MLVLLEKIQLELVLFKLFPLELIQSFTTLRTCCVGITSFRNTSNCTNKLKHHLFETSLLALLP